MKIFRSIEEIENHYFPYLKEQRRREWLYSLSPEEFAEEIAAKFINELRSTNQHIRGISSQKEIV